MEANFSQRKSKVQEEQRQKGRGYVFDLSLGHLQKSPALSERTASIE